MFDDETVLVTGGTGSFGNAFIRLLLREHQPRKIIVLSRDELKQHEMRQHPDLQDERLRYFIGNVRDERRLHRAFEDVDTVVHAAALKQVPACEYNPIEAVETNVRGAQNVINAALDAGVKRLMAISTDKAVNPINLYGATKLVMEKLVVQANAYAGGKGTRSSCVRYGNVVGSRGSVVPLFRQQREQGRVTVTDQRMTRFWLTLDQGTRFVARCIEEMRGGEIFVPKIPSMRIMDLVEAVAPGCEIESIGVRPGEKLHEVLIGEDEARHSVDAGDGYIVQPLHPWWRHAIEGAPLPEGFQYSSDRNPEFLDVEALRGLVDEHE